MRRKDGDNWTISNFEYFGNQLSQGRNVITKEKLYENLLMLIFFNMDCN